MDNFNAENYIRLLRDRISYLTTLVNDIISEIDSFLEENENDDLENYKAQLEDILYDLNELRQITEDIIKTWGGVGINNSSEAGYEEELENLEGILEKIEDKLDIIEEEINELKGDVYAIMEDLEEH
mgnify:CR=1 FL=1